MEVQPTESEATGDSDPWDLAPPDAKPGPKPKRARQLPDDWAPNEKHRELAANLRVNPAVEQEKFRDYHLAKGMVFRDWDAAFRNWLRNAAEFSNKNTRQRRSPASAPIPEITD